MPNGNLSEFSEEELLERLSRAIETCQHIHNDSRTPIDDAMKLIEPIRTLVECRRVLRIKAFRAADSENKYLSAVTSLEKINNTIKAEVMARDKTLEFVENAATAAAAVLDFAIAIGMFL